MSFISINKLFEKLPEDELRQIHLYFDDVITDVYDKTKMNVKPLLLGLVYKDNTRKTMSYKELKEMYPELYYVKVPKYIFKNHSLTISLRKVVIDAARVSFKNDKFYHKCSLKYVPDQTKLKHYQDERVKVNSEYLNKLAQTENENENDDYDEFI